MSPEPPDAPPEPGAPHATTAGWGEPEPAPTDFDLPSSDHAPADGADGADGADDPSVAEAQGPDPEAAEPPPSPLPPLDRPRAAPADDTAPWPDDSDEVDGWDAPEAAAARPSAAAAPWSELEDEARTLPPGLERVGRVESVRLVGVALPALLARLDTGRSRSSLHGEVQSADGDRVRVRLADAVCDLPQVAGEPADAVWARVTVRLGRAELPLTVRVAAPTDGEALVLGCDLLAGRFVVDPAARLLADIDGPADPAAIAQHPGRG